MTDATLDERPAVTVQPEPTLPPYQDLRTLARNVCMGRSTIDKLVRRGRFPKPTWVGGKRVWSWTEVVRHIENRKGRGAASKSPDTQAEDITHATRQATASKGR